jgi:hypothetical protein
VTRGRKLLRRMRASRNGWRPHDLEALYLAFGFEKAEGSKHTLYYHPKYPGFQATVRRADPLPTGYIDDAVKLVDRLLEMDNDL